MKSKFKSNIFSLAFYIEIVMSYCILLNVHLNTVMIKNTLFLRKFAPKFVVELEPELVIDPGENVHLVCIINDSLDNIQWQKDGKKVCDYNQFVYF